ncbi:MAG: Mg2+/Co2+ transporter CorC [Myxococcota bacterium]|jgi:Mg2+/Co2+ transporter CorC
MPKTGDSVPLGSYLLRVEEVARRRVTRIGVTIIEPEELDDAS